MTVSHATRELVLERDNQSCVSCGERIFGHDYSLHHRIPRGMGGSRVPWIDLPANLLTLCGSGTTGCHGWVESHRVTAREWGYLVRRPAEPCNVAVLTYAGWRMFDNDAMTLTVPRPNVSAETVAEITAHADRAVLIRTGAREGARP